MDEPIKILYVYDKQNVLDTLRWLFLADDYEILIANPDEDVTL